MGYNLNKLKQELVSKNLADDGLVCWGQKSSAGALFGGIGGGLSAMSNMVVLCKNGDSLLVIPFTNKEIKYGEAVRYNKNDISSMSVSGLLTKSLTIVSNSGVKTKYSITQGAGDLKVIVNSLK